MCDWASHEFKLNTPDKEGVPLREHLEQVKRMTGREPEELRNPTEFPNLLSHIWSFFLELHRTRSQGFSGFNPISYQDIQAWATLKDYNIRPLDVGTIVELDNTFLRK